MIGSAPKSFSQGYQAHLLVSFRNGSSVEATVSSRVSTSDADESGVLNAVEEAAQWDVYWICKEGFWLGDAFHTSRSIDMVTIQSTTLKEGWTSKGGKVREPWDRDFRVMAPSDEETAKDRADRSGCQSGGDSLEVNMHPFERNARNDFERQAGYAAKVLGCDVAHVVSIAAQQLRVLADGVEKGQRDDATDLRAARKTPDERG